MAGEVRAAVQCWPCGVQWRCPKCGCPERRSDGCVACQRTRQRDRYRARRAAVGKPVRPGNRFVVTPAMRAYLAVFDAFLRGEMTASTRREAFHELMVDTRDHDEDD